MRARKYPDHPLWKELDKRGWTQQMFADMMGYDRTFVSNIITRKYKSQQTYTLQRMADVLEMPIEEVRKLCQ